MWSIRLEGGGGVKRLLDIASHSFIIKTHFSEMRHLATKWTIVEKVNISMKNIF